MPDGDTKPDTNKSIITWVVVTLATNATIGVSTLSFVLITGNKPDPVIFTAFVAIVNYILGVLSGMLAKTAPTETTKQVSVSNQPVVVPAEPTEIKA